MVEIKTIKKSLNIKIIDFGGCFISVNNPENRYKAFDNIGVAIC